MSYDIKKLPPEQENESVKHNLNSKIKVITKSWDELKVLEKEMKFDEIFYSSDSRTTLFWIKSFENEFGIFVENRLQEIRNWVSWSSGDILKQGITHLI